MVEYSKSSQQKRVSTKFLCQHQQLWSNIQHIVNHQEPPLSLWSWNEDWCRAFHSFHSLEYCGNLFGPNDLNWSILPQHHAPSIHHLYCQRVQVQWHLQDHNCLQLTPRWSWIQWHLQDHNCLQLTPQWSWKKLKSFDGIYSTQTLILGSRTASSFQAHKNHPILVHCIYYLFTNSMYAHLGMNHDNQ